MRLSPSAFRSRAAHQRDADDMRDGPAVDTRKRWEWTLDSRKKTHHSIALSCTASYKHAMAPQPAHGAKAH